MFINGQLFCPKDNGLEKQVSVYISSEEAKSFMVSKVYQSRSSDDDRLSSGDTVCPLSGDVARVISRDISWLCMMRMCWSFIVRM